MVILKGFWGKFSLRNRGTISAVALSDWEKSRKTSVRIANLGHRFQSATASIRRGIANCWTASLGLSNYHDYYYYFKFTNVYKYTENNILKWAHQQCSGSLRVLNCRHEQPTDKITHTSQHTQKEPQMVHPNKHGAWYYSIVRFYLSTLHSQTWYKRHGISKMRFSYICRRTEF